MSEVTELIPHLQKTLDQNSRSADNIVVAIALYFIKYEALCKQPLPKQKDFVTELGIKRKVGEKVWDELLTYFNIITTNTKGGTSFIEVLTANHKKDIEDKIASITQQPLLFHNSNLSGFIADKPSCSKAINAA